MLPGAETIVRRSCSRLVCKIRPVVKLRISTLKAVAKTPKNRSQELLFYGRGMDYLLLNARAFSPAALIPAALQNGENDVAKAEATRRYKSKFSLQIFYPLWNRSRKAIVQSSLRLNCMAMT